MAYIKKKSERKFKITVCNGYKVNGQKRMKAQTITVPSSVPKRGIQQFTYRFKLILKANNLPLDLNVHSLRHTNASLLIAQGVDVRTVASLLGHAQASTTLDIYAHAFDKNKRKAQEKLGKAIGL